MKDGAEVGLPDYWIDETQERVGEFLGTRLTRGGAEKLRAAHPPAHPGLRYEVERIGPFRWAVVGYQNIPIRKEAQR